MALSRLSPLAGACMPRIPYGSTFIYIPFTQLYRNANRAWLVSRQVRAKLRSRSYVALASGLPAEYLCLARAVAGRYSRTKAGRRIQLGEDGSAFVTTRAAVCGAAERSLAPDGCGRSLRTHGNAAGVHRTGWRDFDQGHRCRCTWWTRKRWRYGADGHLAMLKHTQSTPTQ
jgi:hypothetical protein